jgi:hypothetical protein
MLPRFRLCGASGLSVLDLPTALNGLAFSQSNGNLTLFDILMCMRL